MPITYLIKWYFATRSHCRLLCSSSPRRIVCLLRHRRTEIRRRAQCSPAYTLPPVVYTHIWYTVLMVYALITDSFTTAAEQFAVTYAITVPLRTRYIISDRKRMVPCHSHCERCAHSHKS